MRKNKTDPALVIPLFFTSDTSIRIGICIFLHPVLLEAGEALGRGTRCEATANDLATGRIKTFEEAAEAIMEKSTLDFGFKILMALFRRMMLLNMGSPNATMFGVVAASIEEVRLRAFLSVHIALTIFKIDLQSNNL